MIALSLLVLTIVGCAQAKRCPDPLTIQDSYMKEKFNNNQMLGAYGEGYDYYELAKHDYT